MKAKLAYWNSLTDVQQGVIQAQCAADGQHSERVAIDWAWRKKEMREQAQQDKLNKARHLVETANRGFAIINGKEYSLNDPFIAELAQDEIDWAKEYVKENS